MTPEVPREDEPLEETVEARDMSQKETQAKPGRTPKQASEGSSCQT